MKSTSWVPDPGASATRLLEWVTAYVQLHERVPSQDEIASRLGVTRGWVIAALDNLTRCALIPYAKSRPESLAAYARDLGVNVDTAQRYATGQFTARMPPVALRPRAPENATPEAA